LYDTSVETVDFDATDEPELVALTPRQLIQVVFFDAHTFVPGDKGAQHGRE
jgi:hypothetical protein